MTREEAIWTLENGAWLESLNDDMSDADKNHLFDAPDMAISALRAQQDNDPPSGWISVKDRLPTDEDDMVLAIVSGKPCENITLDGAYELATYIERECWIIESYPEWETSQVTNWMPLPEPPEEGTV